MPEPSIPTENDHSGPQDHGSHDKADDAKEIFFRCRPIAFYRYVAQQCEEYTSEKEKRDHFTRLIRTLCCRVAFSRLTLWVILAASTVGVVLWLTSLEIYTAEQTVALFTGLLLVGVLIQFVATSLQWLAMKQQSAQTSEALEHLRLGQRAWLTVIDATVKKITVGEQIRCSLKIRNTGNTPGKIVAGTIFCCTRPDGFPEQVIIDEFEGRGFLHDDQFIVPPRKNITVVVTDLGPLDDTAFQAVESGNFRLHILCRFRYIDAMDKTHNAKAFYTLDLKDRGLYLRNNYGSMD